MGAPLCEICQKRRARYVRPGWKKVAADKSHTLCKRCWTAEMDRQRQQTIPDRPGSTSE
jgi:hypothetical protein